MSVYNGYNSWNNVKMSQNTSEKQQNTSLEEYKCLQKGGYHATILQWGKVFMAKTCLSF